METYTLENMELIRSRNKNHTLDPVTFEFIGLTDEQKTWTKVDVDGPQADMFTLSKWLTDHGITEWYWLDRVPHRMVNSNTLYFKNEGEAIWFLLWWR